jgi:Zinc carboxypeptidase
MRYFCLKINYDLEKWNNKKRYYLNLDHLLTWQNYHRISDINGYLDYLATTYPNIVQVISIGSSIEGRPINLVKISSSTSTASTPAFFIDGGRFFIKLVTSLNLMF